MNLETSSKIVLSVPDLATVGVLFATLPITMASCRALLQVEGHQDPS